MKNNFVESLLNFLEKDWVIPFFGKLQLIVLLSYSFILLFI